MSPAARLWGACRALAVRTRPIAAHRKDCLIARSAILRTYSADTTRPPFTGNSPPTEHTSESAVYPDQDVAHPANSSVDENPYEQESEFPETLDLDYLDNSVMEQLYGGQSVTRTSEGGLTAAQEEVLYSEGTIPSPQEAEVKVASEKVEEMPAQKSRPQTVMEWEKSPNSGHKFPLPKKPYPEGYNLKKRYHPVLEQFTRLLMKDGKLSVAQRNVAMVMNFLRTAPAPIYSPKYPLLPGAPPAYHLPLNPVLYITIAIDSVAPLLKVRNIAGAGGGGRALELPVPLAVRQRRRIAISWILDVIAKKPSKGSGRKQFPHRIAEEIIAVVEGRSGVWEKRKQVHKLGTAARANIGSRKLKVKKKM
ncbi:hypothetical protein E4U55_005481 [Claviceps digitariae]|nr:hypothetical protein E4U55_005481 [Claviceps digitariae]